MLNPKRGSIVQIWYRDKSMPFHGRYARVVVAGTGKPRNHLVRVDGELVIVPCGNLRKPKAAAQISHESGTFGTYMSKLRGLELIEGGRGVTRASREFFE